MSAWQLNENHIATIIPRMQSQTTEQLLQTWNTEILSAYCSEEIIEAVRRVLAQRGTTPPTRMQLWLKTNATVLLIFGGIEAIILLLILRDIWQEKSVDFPPLIAMAVVAVLGWLWIKQYLLTRDLLATEPEPAQTILRKQEQAYRVEFILLPLCWLALFKFGFQTRFPLFGGEVSILALFSFIVLLPTAYLGASAIKHQLLLYYSRTKSPKVARGNWARVGGALLLCVYLIFGGIQLFGTYH